MDRFNAINERMVSGDAERGNAVLKRIASLATITDAQQQYMHHTETFSPQDARDFLTALAIHGVHIVAAPENAIPPAHTVAEL